MLYPLKFDPILKDRIWGGTKLHKFFAKESMSSTIGESWEVSGLEGSESVVTNGKLKGNKLTELIEVYMGDLLGKKVYKEFGTTLPLLFKLINANDNLSIQVHPDNEAATRLHNSLGKSELWYVLDADKDAELILGFSQDSSKEEYLAAMEANKVEEILQTITVAKGDVFYIPAGTVHSLGKGIVIAEIQQSSDITYRIYDYNRVDDKGNKRELHTEQALEVIDFSALPQPKVDYKAVLNEISPIHSNEFFNLNVLNIDQATNRNYGHIDSFVVYICTEGNVAVEYKSEKTIVNKGDTILIPACIKEIGLIPEGNASLLEVYCF